MLACLMIHYNALGFMHAFANRVQNVCSIGIINTFSIKAYQRLRCALISLDISGYSIFRTSTTPVDAGGVCNTFATLNKGLKINLQTEKENPRHGSPKAIGGGLA